MCTVSHQVIIEIHIYIARIKSSFFVKNIKKKKRKYKKKHVQLEAPPGQPVCKHSSIECVLWKGARASVPQQTPAGPPGCATWAGPPQPTRCTPFPSVLGRTGEDGLESTLSSVLGHTVFVTHGFSWRLGSPWGGSLGREARGVPEEATWLGISLAEVAIKLSLGVGQPLPAGQLWSHRLVPLVSSVHSCSCPSGLSFRKGPAGGQLY